MSEQMQIGAVAELTSLSLRTIRHYDEVGLVEPSARSQGGFRLYTTADVERLLLVKRMKPLDFTLEEMRELLAARDRLAAGALTTAERRELLDRLDSYRALADERCAKLQRRLTDAQAFASQIGDEIDEARRTAD